MPKTITREQYLQLLGLKVLADKHNEALHDILSSAATITGEAEPLGGGHTDEMVWSDLDVDTTLNGLGIEVEE
jgi:hypothetical protein